MSEEYDIKLSKDGRQYGLAYSPDEDIYYWQQLYGNWNVSKSFDYFDDALEWFRKKKPFRESDFPI